MVLLSVLVPRTVSYRSCMGDCHVWNAGVLPMLSASVPACGNAQKCSAWLPLSHSPLALTQAKSSVPNRIPRTKDSSPESAPHRLALAAVAFAIFVETVDTSIVPVALPAMTHTFETGFTRIQWVVLASVLTQASLSLVIGAFGDIAGKKQILLAGLVLTGIGTLLCMVAPTLNWLIAFRVLQGMGMTMAGALIMGIVTETFPATQQTKAFGFIGMMVSLGIVIGPLAGGLILRSFSWRLIFAFDAVFIVLAIPLAYGYLQSSPGQGWRGFDVPGAIAFFASLFTFLLAGTFSQQTTDLPYGSLLYVLSGVSFLLFIVRELRTPHPLLDLRLFQRGEFSLYLGTRYMVFFLYGGIWLILPFYL